MRVEIDERQLTEMQHLIELYPNGTHAVISEDPIGRGAWAFDGRGLLELIRLARLGLWAERHAIPAIRKYPCQVCYAPDSLAAIPKESQ